MEPILQVKKLSKMFQQTSILRDVNLDLHKGHSLVIMGSSGSGKSVLMKCILGIILPDLGSKVRLNGQNVEQKHISQRPGFVQDIGVMFQSSALFDSMKIWENVVFGLINNQSQYLNKSELYQIAIDKLAMVRLGAEVADLYPEQISHGMQKRVALARTVAREPKILFFDEPTSGLDPIISAVVSELIVDLAKKIKATVVAVTHDLTCAANVADQIAIIHSGTISQVSG